MQLFPAFTSLSLGATIIAFTFCVGAEPGYSRTEKRRIHSTALAIIFTTAAATASSLCPVGAMSTALLVLTLVLLLALFLSIACAGDEMSTLQGSSETSDSSDDMHITVQQACQTIEFWMYISVYCISAGSGQLILTNLAQIATVIGFPHQCQALLCCFSTCSQSELFWCIYVRNTSGYAWVYVLCRASFPIIFWCLHVCVCAPMFLCIVVTRQVICLAGSFSELSATCFNAAVPPGPSFSSSPISLLPLVRCFSSRRPRVNRSCCCSQGPLLWVWPLVAPFRLWPPGAVVVCVLGLVIIGKLASRIPT